MLAFIQLTLRSDAAINTDRATELSAINANQGSGAGDYDNQTDSDEAIADAALTLSDIFTYVIETGYTFEATLRIMASVLAGESAGGGTGTITFRDLLDTKNRVSATVDASNNRTAVTLDGS